MSDGAFLFWKGMELIYLGMKKSLIIARKIGHSRRGDLIELGVLEFSGEVVLHEQYVYDL